MKERIKADKIRQKAVKREILIDESSSESDGDGIITCDSTDLESELSNTEDKSVAVGDFILVKYIRKKYEKYYIGQVEKIEEKNYSISFLKRLPSSKFVFPETKGEDTIRPEDVILKLPLPYVSGTTSRAARQFSFSVDSSKYKFLKVFSYFVFIFM